MRKRDVVLGNSLQWRKKKKKEDFFCFDLLTVGFSSRAECSRPRELFFLRVLGKAILTCGFYATHGISSVHV